MKSNLWQIDLALDHYGILSKLLFNESSVKVTEGILRTLGFVHLYTASGIHLYALLDAIEKLFYRLTAGFQSRRFEVKRIGIYVGIVLLIYLWSLQSYRLGFARPILIFLIRTWARERGMKWRIFYPLGITYLIDLALKIESGRAHYYLAVGGGLLGMDWAKQRKKGLFAEHAWMSLGSWLFTAGIDLYFHHTVAWMTPIWSLFTLPIISLVLYPLTIASLLITHKVQPALYPLWNHLIDGCIWISDHGFTFSLVTPSAVWLGFVFAIFAGILMLKKVDFRFRLVGLLLLLMIAPFFQFDDSRIVQVDVKQGDSMVMVKDQRVEMVDVGSKKAMRPDQWIQRLCEQGVTHVDVILLSHMDEDHVGGLENLVAWVPIEVIQTHHDHWMTEHGQKWIRRVRERSSVTLSEGNHLKLMKLGWFLSDSKRDGNAFMAGVLAPLDDHRVYLALGDGDDSQEARYLDYYRSELDRYPVRIWKAGHHGSKFSSGMEEMFRLHPSRVWISVGKKNRYHHPTVEAMNRLGRLKVPLQRTDEEGDLVEKISQSFFDKITG